MKIFSNSEFGQLKSVVIGQTGNAHWPKGDPFFDLMSSASTWPTPLKTGPIADDIVAQANDELDFFAETLDKQNITVYRPQHRDWSVQTRTHDHATTGMHTYSTRDLLLVTDNMVIECPTPTVSRQHEVVAYDHIRRQAIQDQCRWIAAPVARVLPEDISIQNNHVTLANTVPMFDAANVLKHGDKLLYLVSSSGNELGADWLQTIVGTGREVIKWKDVYAFSHIDSTLCILNHNTILVNAHRVTKDKLPAFLQHCDIIWVEDMVPGPFRDFPFSSKWIGMNVLSVDPETVVVDPLQQPLIAQLREKGFRVLEVPLTHSRTLGGGHHCASLDLEREPV